MNTADKRILLLLESMQNVGGTERMVHALSTLLAGDGKPVFQATFDPPGASRHFEGDTPCHRLGPIPRLPLLLRPFAYSLAARRLNRLKKRLNIDVTISNLWGADLISILSFGRDRKIALCHINVIGNPVNRLMMRLRPLVAAIYRRFDRVIAVNQTLSSELEALYCLPANKVGYINNFADRPVAASKLPPDGLQRFIWCGRFVYEKNVEGLLHVWSRFACGRDNVQLVLVGDGPLRSELTQLAARAGLHLGASLSDKDAQVLFLGLVPDPPSYMLGARALILTSRAEGLPMVILEALSLGLPVLAADGPSGGERAALKGEGRCNPLRADVENAPAGALLPVPRADELASLQPWVDALSIASQDEPQWRAWRDGALERAVHFSSASAREKWLQALDFTSSRS